MQQREHELITPCVAKAAGYSDDDAKRRLNFIGNILTPSV